MATTRKTPSEPVRRASAKLKKSNQRVADTNRAGSVSGPSAATAAATLATPAEAKAVDRFVRDLQVRGEAAKPGSDGKLELSATHAVTAEREGLVQKVKRARFKTF